MCQIEIRSSSFDLIPKCLNWVVVDKFCALCTEWKESVDKVNGEFQSALIRREFINLSSLLNVYSSLLALQVVLTNRACG